MPRSYSKTLNIAEARHLLSRATFSINWKTLKKFTGLNSDTAVDILIQNSKKLTTPTPPDWINKSFKYWWNYKGEELNKVINETYETLYKENWELKRWWLEVMTNDTESLTEKMTLFWHGHFTSRFAIDEPMAAQLMYIQNNLFRTNHLGNFRQLTEKICIDGAMLVFLNGQGSSKKAPNENFARELLELYTTGIGHYTENDVKEAARVFTGWNVSIFGDESTTFGPFVSYLKSYEHDNLSKTFLGDQIPAVSTNDQPTVFKEEIQRLVNIILKNRKNAVAEFVCKKLYHYFIYSNPLEENSDFIKELAEIFINNNWNIEPVVSSLLKSELFFSEQYRGIQIKNPAESVVGLTHHFDVKPDWKEWVMLTLGLELLNPPTVAGWPGYRKWTDSRTFPFAVQQFSYFVWNQTASQILNWIGKFDQTEDPKLLISDIATLFFPLPLNQTQLQNYLKVLMGGSPDYEWPNILKNKEQAALKLKVLLIEMIKSPNAHLT